MSTKVTLFLNEDFHLYREAWDIENVYLEMESTSKFVESLVIKIPLPAWKEMRKQTIEPAERYLDLSYDDLRQEAEHQVDEHRAWLKQNETSKIRALAGSFVFGSPEMSRDEMIESFLAYYRPADSAESDRG